MCMGSVYLCDVCVQLSVRFVCEICACVRSVRFFVRFVCVNILHTSRMCVCQFVCVLHGCSHPKIRENCVGML